MDRPPEFQIAAEAHRQVLKPALLVVDGQQVGEGLGGVVVPPVSCVDDRHQGVLAGHQGRALLGMPHGDDVRVAGHGPYRVRHALPLGGGGAGGLGEPQHLPPQAQHGGLEAQPRPGGGLKEQGGQNPAVALVGVGGGIGDDVGGRCHQGLDLLSGELQNIN